MQIVKEVKRSIEYYIKGYDEILDQMSMDITIQGIVIDPSNEKFVRKNLESVHKSREDVMNVYFATTEGVFYLEPYVKMQGYNPLEKEWYKKAIEKNGEVAWTGPYEDSVTGKKILTASRSVYTSNTNELVGVFGVDIPMDTLSNNINNIKIGEYGYVFLLYDDGKVLTHKDTDLLDKKAPVPEIIEAIGNKDEDIVVYEFTNSENKIDEKFSAYVTIEKLGWNVLASMTFDEIDDEIKALGKGAFFYGFIGLIAAVIVGWLFAHSLVKPINRLSKDLTILGEGDFSKRSNISVKNEIGSMAKQFNNMAEQVSGLIKKIRIASGEVSEASEVLASTTEETNASAEAVTNAVEEIAKGASEQAGQAENAKILATEFADKLEELSTTSNTMIRSTDEIGEINEKSIIVIENLMNKNIENSNSIIKIEKVIKGLDSKTKNINNIIETITSIAEQTNLLALNASIEAARAGDAGRGFAVVAEEIRKLAEGSNDAAKEINDIVNDIQIESGNTVKVMEEVKNISNNQNQAVMVVNDSFNGINQSIRAITDNIVGINEFINKLNGDKDEILMAVQNISAISQETAAASEEVNASMEQQLCAIEDVRGSAEKLSQTAEELEKNIDKFKI
nr:methyl-accepting chemotaxis protein [Oceanirhabdus seepicola]